MRCSSCGARLVAEARFCQNCGRQLSEAEAARLRAGWLFGKGRAANGGVHTGPVWLNDGWHQGLGRLRQMRVAGLRSGDKCGADEADRVDKPHVEKD